MTRNKKLLFGNMKTPAERMDTRQEIEADYMDHRTEALATSEEKTILRTR